MKMNVELSKCIDTIGPQIAENGKQADATDQFSVESHQKAAQATPRPLI